MTSNGCCKVIQATEQYRVYELPYLVKCTVHLPKQGMCTYKKGKV